ncbi:MAG TPA: hypothetical protein VJ964_10605 [Balneolaceae bacterium]|nr:hypothetical protein [Balneolaceae bacterium]
MGTNRFIVIFLCLLSAGCASIPKESPELSQEIGRRVAAMRTSHLKLLHKYFDLKRDKVNEIFDNEWIPAYAQSFFSQDQVANYWNKLVTEDDKEERVQFLTRLGPKMLADIQKKRAEYLKPLNTLENQIEDNLRSDYRQILAADNTLTSFLASSSKVAQNRDRYLDMFGIEQGKVNSYIDRIDKRSAQIMKAVKNANLN